MKNSNPNADDGSALPAADSVPDTRGPVTADAAASDEELDVLSEEIEQLASVDAAEAADRAMGIADRLGRKLEESDH